tara:strand:+ start:246 stop:1052 length:807 start_codon:yes stop_codon:yes gene_type:complete
MPDFKQRQDQLRKDLRILLIQKYNNNRSALAGSLNMLPKALRDFLEEDVFMQAAKYDDIIEVLKNYPFTLANLGIADLIRLFENIDASNSESLETLIHTTYEPTDNERIKLMRYFLEGGTIDDIRGFDILNGLDEEDTSFNKDRHVGLIEAMNNTYKDNFERHDTLAAYKPMLDELNTTFASYLFGYLAPNYFLDNNDNQKASIIYMTGNDFKRIRDKSLSSSDDIDIKLSTNDIIFCDNLGYDYKKDQFVRSFGHFINPAKMSKASK